MSRNPFLCKFRKGNLKAAIKEDSSISSSDKLEPLQKHIHLVNLERAVPVLNVKSTSGAKAIDHVSIELEEFQRRRSRSCVDGESVHVASSHNQLTSSHTREDSSGASRPVLLRVQSSHSSQSLLDVGVPKFYTDQSPTTSQKPGSAAPLNETFARPRGQSALPSSRDLRADVYTPHPTVAPSLRSTSSQSSLMSFSIPAVLPAKTLSVLSIQMFELQSRGRGPQGQYQG
jgi:hypothetical protein